MNSWAFSQVPNASDIIILVETPHCYEIKKINSVAGNRCTQLVPQINKIPIELHEIVNDFEYSRLVFRKYTPSSSRNNINNSSMPVRHSGAMVRGSDGVRITETGENKILFIYLSMELNNTNNTGIFFFNYGVRLVSEKDMTEERLQNGSGPINWNQIGESVIGERQTDKRKENIPSIKNAFVQLASRSYRMHPAFFGSETIFIQCIRREVDVPEGYADWISNLISHDTLERLKQLLTDHDQFNQNTNSDTTSEPILKYYIKTISQQKSPDGCDDNSSPSFLTARYVIKGMGFEAISDQTDSSEANYEINIVVKTKKQDLNFQTQKRVIPISTELRNSGIENTYSIFAKCIADEWLNSNETNITCELYDE